MKNRNRYTSNRIVYTTSPILTIKIIHSSSSPLMPHFSWLPSHDLFVSPTNTPGFVLARERTLAENSCLSCPTTPACIRLQKSPLPNLIDCLTFNYSQTLQIPNTISKQGARLPIDQYNNINQIDIPLKFECVTITLNIEREIETDEEF